MIASTVVATPAAQASTSSGSSAATATQEDASHDGHSSDTTLKAPLAQRWSASFPGPVFAPLIVDGRMFIDYAHDDWPGDGNPRNGTSLEARSASTGKVLWGPVDLGGTYDFGAIAYGSGAVVALNYDGVLRSFDAATGKLRWSVELDHSDTFTAPPTVSDGLVYVFGADTIYATDAASGTLRWHASNVNADQNGAPVVATSGLYDTGACQQAYALTAAGALRWHHDTSCFGGGGTQSVLHLGRLYVRNAPRGTTPAAIDTATGKVVGHFTSDVAPAFSGNTMITLHNGTLSAVDLTTGKARWHRTNRLFVSTPITVNGYVAEARSDGVVDLLSLIDGAARWSGHAGHALSPTNESNAGGRTGLAEAQGVLAVPADDTLTVFGNATSTH